MIHPVCFHSQISILVDTYRILILRCPLTMNKLHLLLITLPQLQLFDLSNLPILTRVIRLKPHITIIKYIKLWIITLYRKRKHKGTPILLQVQLPLLLQVDAVICCLEGFANV